MRLGQVGLDQDLLWQKTGARLRGLNFREASKPFDDSIKLVNQVWANDRRQKALV